MAEAKNVTDEVAVFGTKEVSLKEFMGSSDKSLVLLSDFEKAKENLVELKEKHEARATELVALEVLSPSELKELNNIRAELREPRYLVQNIEKNNISVFEAYKKTDKANLKKLIDINKELEDKVDVKIKAEEQRKKDEKELAAQAEENRINTIKERIDTFETDSYKIIQATTFDDVELNKTMLDALANTDFDFEEYDILFEQAKARVQVSWDSKCTDVKQREEQRLENDRMKQEIFDVRVSRLTEIGFKYNAGSLEHDITEIILHPRIILSMSSSDFEDCLLDMKTEINRAEVDKNNSLEKQQKDEQFEVRKTRFGEIGFGITQNEHFFFCRDFSNISVSVDSVYNASVTEFEQILSKAKQDVVDAEAEKEAVAKNERFESRKLSFENAGVVINEETQIFFPKSNLYLTLNALYDEVGDDRFNELLNEFVECEKEAKEKAEKEAKKKADSENKARVKRLAKDKESIQNALTLIKETVIGEIVFRKYDNEETESFRAKLEVDFDKFIDDCSTQLNDL